MRRPVLSGCTRAVAVLALGLLLPGCALMKSVERGDYLATLREASKLSARASECGKLRDPVVPVSEEYALGGAVASRWVKEGGGLLAAQGQARALTLYLNRVGRLLAAQSSRPLLGWTFGVLESPAVNAVSAPAGYVFVTRGLLQRLENEAQLAGVLAHEIAHVTQRHALTTYANVRANQCVAAMGAGELQQAAAPFVEALKSGELNLDASPELLARFMDETVERLTTQGFAEPDELAADEEALRLLISTGYQPLEFIALLGRLPDGDQGYRNHPRNATRQERLRRWLGEQRERPGEFPEVDPEHAQLPVVPFKGQLDWVQKAR